MIRFALIFQAGLVLVALVLGWLTGTPAFARLSLDASGLLTGVLATVPVLALVLGSLWARVPAVDALHDVARRLLLPLLKEASIAQRILLCLLAGVGEEALFRGVLQCFIAEQAGALTGLLLASALFGLVHWVSWAYALFAALLGLYLGVAFVLADNLLVPIVIHGLYDLVLVGWLLMRRGRG